MLPDCSFLESNRRKRWLPRYTCAAGVNFYSVGPERALCHTCPIADWGQALTCEHLEVYTFLQANGHRELSVQAEMECRQPGNSLSNEARCTICPEGRTQQSALERSAGFRRTPGVVVLSDMR